jgi:single-strand DNA-binding protein
VALPGYFIQTKFNLTLKRRFFMGVNRFIGVGNLGADCELRFTPSGQAVARARIALTETFTDKAGVKQERTEWVRLVIWGKRAEALAPYLTKGKMIYAEGSLRTDSWEQNGVKRYSTEVIVRNIQLLGGGNGKAANGNGAQSHLPEMDAPEASGFMSNGPVPEADIPF